MNGDVTKPKTMLLYLKYFNFPSSSFHSMINLFLSSYNFLLLVIKDRKGSSRGDWQVDNSKDGCTKNQTCYPTNDCCYENTAKLTTT